MRENTRKITYIFTSELGKKKKFPTPFTTIIFVSSTTILSKIKLIIEC